MSLAVIKKAAGMAEADPIQTAAGFNDLLGLAGPGDGEGEFGLFGPVVGDALGAPAAPLAGIHHKKSVGFVQAVFPGQIAGQHHDAVFGGSVGGPHLFVRPVDRVGRLDLTGQDLLCDRHRLKEAVIGAVGAVPGRIEKADGIAQAVLLAGVVVQVQRLNEIFIDEAGLTFPNQAGTQHPPQQPEGSVRHPVGAGLTGLPVVVEHTVADVIDDAVEVIRHHKAPADFDVRAQDLQKCGRKHIVGVELAGVGKNRGLGSSLGTPLCTELFS